MENLLTGIMLGITLTFVGAYVVRELDQRLNHGKRVLVNRREAGYVVTCRFNGSKKWYYVDTHGIISTEYYLSKKAAVRACTDHYIESRPTKQTTFSRVA